MDEYISREETVKAFCEKCKGYYDGHCIHRGECDVDVIQTAPTADVELVRHGRWIEKPNSAYCSICRVHWSREFIISLRKTYKFCPTCGAKMDGGDE